MIDPPQTFLRGELCDLEPVRAEHATAEYVGWLNDAETTRFMESGYFPSTLASVQAYIEAMRSRSDVLFLAIIDRELGRHVGNIKLEPIQWIHRNAELGIMIGDPEARGRGLGTEACHLVLRHAFDRLGLHRVGLGVVEDNRGAIRAYEKVGFQVEGALRQAIQRDGRSFDVVRMGILATEFRQAHA